MRKALSLFTILFVCASLLLSCGEEEKYGSQLGDRCPEYSLSKITSSGTDNISNHRDGKVIIHFFGIWCAGGELDVLDGILKEHGGVTVLAIHSSHERLGARDYISENYTDSDIIFLYDEPVKESEDKYYTMLGGTDTYPRTLILDENGIITFIKDGSITHEEIEANI